MNSITRRLLLRSGYFALIGTKFARAQNLNDQASTSANCIATLDQLNVESSDSPFFEHFHQISIPNSALISTAKTDLVLKSSPVDVGSYDPSAFKKFVQTSGLSSQFLLGHSHDVTLTAKQLERIASGEKNVEIRVISKNGNYVHNFLITAPPSLLVKIRRQRGRT